MDVPFVSVLLQCLWLGFVFHENSTKTSVNFFTETLMSGHISSEAHNLTLQLLSSFCAWELLQMLLQTWTWSTCVLGYQLSCLWCRRDGSWYIFWVQKNCCKKYEAISNTTDDDITYAQGHPGLAQLGMEFSQIYLHALFGLCPNESRLPAHMGTQRMRRDFTSRQTWQLLSSQK